MKEISKFFDKFNNIALIEIKKREAISKAILSVIKQEISFKDIKINNMTIEIKGNQGLKSEIYIKKQLVLKQILKLTGVKYIDIK